jgi:hypothetical protein
LQFHCGKPPPAAEPNTRISTASSRSAFGDRPGNSGAAFDQRFAMYELISIPKRNTTAAGVTHFMCKFLVLIIHQVPAIDPLAP